MTETTITEITQIGISLLLGSILGLEREYRSKAAGFRTLALICVGATTFTILSGRLGISSPDRIASNIVTGIGFIGAGVIFKNGANVLGLTTAATVWLSAAIGMAVGAKDYMLAMVVTVVALIILSIFEYFQFSIDAFHQRRLYSLTFDGHTLDDDLEKAMKEHKLTFRKTREVRTRTETTSTYEVYGKQNRLDAFNELLLNTEGVTSFEY